MALFRNLLRRSVSRFARDRRGSVAVIWAICALVVLSFIGVALDFSRAHSVKQSLQNAADAAALVAERMADKPLAERQAAAEQYFRATLAAYSFGADATINIEHMPGGGHKVSASIPSPTTLSRLIADRDMVVRTSSEAKQEGSDLEVSVVLDITGSMSGQRITDLKAAAVDLVNIVVRDQQEPYYSKVGLVPYSIGVNLGANAAAARGPVTPPVNISAATWRNGATKNITGATRANPVVITSNAHGFANGDYVYITGVAGMTQLNNGANATWQVGNVTANTFIARSTNGPAFSNYTSGGQSFCTVAGCEYFRFMNASSTSVQRVHRISTCVSERVGPQAYTSAAPSAAWVGRVYDSTSNPCPGATVTPMTSDKTALTSAINAYTVTGSTAGHIGIAWGWYMLSPTFSNLWPAASQPKPYGSPNLRKIAVIMTDGEFNTPYCTGVIARNAGTGSGNASDKITCNATNGNPFDQARALCTAMKNSGVTVYTVGFGLSNGSTAASVMQDCASGAGNAFSAANGAELRAAFRSIATAISLLRLSK